MTDISETIAERGARYGDFTDHARISQDLQRVMQTEPSWWNLSNDKREALTLITHKIARILNGDPEYADSWHDIGGYAKLAEERCIGAAPEVTAKTDVVWIPHFPGADRPTGPVDRIRFRSGEEYRCGPLVSWDWSERGAGTITHYRLAGASK